MVVCGDLWWFVVVCGRLRWFAMVCGGLSYSHTVFFQLTKGHATRNDIVDDIVDVSSSTMVFNVAKIASAHASLTISLTKSLRVAGP